MDSFGKKAGKGPLIQIDRSGTIGVSQDQVLFQCVKEMPFSPELTGGGREGEEPWIMTTEKNSVILCGTSPAVRSRDYKDAPIVAVRTERNTSSAG